MDELNQQPIAPLEPKMNWFSRNRTLAYCLLALLVIGIAGGGYWLLYEKEQLPSQNPIPAGNNNEEVTQPEPLPGSFNISDIELLAKANLTDKFLTYAIKDKNHVSVYKRDLKTGQQTKLFEYDERSEASFSGNTWQSLPPSIDFDVKNQRFVYSDDQGLKSYDQASKTTKSLIVQTKEADPEIETKAPEWNPAIPHAYSLVRPRWSADGRYISFNLTQYEGTALSAFDTQTGKYIPFTVDGQAVAGYEVSTSSKWSPVGATFLEPLGLYVSSAADATKLSAIVRPQIPKEVEFANFAEASFSSDGNKIAFTYMDTFGDEGQGKNKLAIINKDGSGFKVLSDKEEKSNPLFTPQGDVLYTVNRDGQTVLLRYNVTSNKAESILTLPSHLAWNLSTESRWTKEGHLLMTGSNRPTSQNNTEPFARFVIIDLSKREVVYSSAKLPYHSLFVSLTAD